MELSDRVKVDLYGQYNNNTEHAYSYPDKITNQYSFTGNTAWAAAITDPRALFQSVCKAGPCYQIYRHRNGYYYSLIVRNPADSRSGLEMVTVFVPKGIVAAGNSVLDVLHELRNLLITKHLYNDELVASCIGKIKASHSKGLFPDKSTENKSMESPSRQPVTAYRTYGNDAELTEIFTFLKQEEYSGIDKLLIVAESDIKENTSVRRLGKPIKRLYNIVPTQGVSSDLSEVAADGKFRITYSREGFESLTTEVTLNPAISHHFHIRGNDAYLLSPSDSHISFALRLNIRLDASEGPSPDARGAEVMFDGHPARRDAAGKLFVLVPEDSILAGSKADLLVSAAGYEQFRTTVSLDRPVNNAVVTARLTPRKKLLRTVIHIGDPTHEVRCFPAVELPFNETDSMLGHIMEGHGFFGYETYHSGNGEFHVNIPWGHWHKDGKPEAHRRGMPGGLKATILTLAGLLTATALLLGGYAIRNYTDVKIPGLYTAPAEQVMTQPEDSQQ